MITLYMYSSHTNLKTIMITRGFPNRKRIRHAFMSFNVTSAIDQKNVMPGLESYDFRIAADDRLLPSDKLT